MSKKQSQPPKRHHYVPQFYLRNFAIDEQKTKVMAVHKHGNRAAWAKTSIKSIAYEHELYVHRDGDSPVSVEETISRNLGKSNLPKRDLGKNLSQARFPIWISKIEQSFTAS